MLGTWLLLGVLANDPALAAVADPVHVTAGDEVAACGWPSVVRVLVGPAQCSGVLVHPQLVLLTSGCPDYQPGTDVSLAFGDTSGTGIDAVAAIDACSFAEDGLGLCKLSAALPIPYAPILAGCERSALTVGGAVTLVGYGTGVSGEYDTTKRHGEATVQDLGVGVFFIEGEHAPCTGDSGAPVLVRVDDDTWRVAGMVVNTYCDNPTVVLDLTSRIAWIENTSGIDVTPCHDANGLPDPSPECGGFYAGDAGGVGTWGDLCAGAPVGGDGGVCSGDIDPPTVSITSPVDGSEYPDAVAVTLEIAADDGDGLGVRDVRLQIDGTLLPDEDREPPYAFAVDLPVGQWPIVAIARDWGGNATMSTTTTLWVGVSPPESGTSSSDGGAIDGSGTDTGAVGGSTGVGGESSGGSTATPDDPQGGGNAGGCGCAASNDRGGWLVLLAVVAWGRRRRVAWLASAAVACGGSNATGSETTSGSDDAPASDTAIASSTTRAATSSSSTDATSTDGGVQTSSASTSSASTSSGDTSSASSSASSGSGGSSSGGHPEGPAGPGYEDCLAGVECTLGGLCLQNTWEVVGVCAVPCTSTDDCPLPEASDAIAQCRDVDGFGSTYCVIDCASGHGCPDDMTCYADAFCMYLVAPAGGGTCPDDSVVGAPATVTGMTASDDITTSCFISGDDATIEFTADALGWYAFDAEDASGPTLAALTACDGPELQCATGFAQYTARFLRRLDADETIVLVVDTGDPAAYQLDIAYLGDPPDGDCCLADSHIGCQDDGVEACVCGVVLGCCDSEWSEACTILATGSCGADCG